MAFLIVPLSSPEMAPCAKRRLNGSTKRAFSANSTDRSQLLTEKANRRLSGLLDVEHAQSGMRTVAWIRIRVPKMVLTRRAKRLGLEVVPISSYVSKYEQKPALMLGFAGCNASEIKRGVYDPIPDSESMGARLTIVAVTLRSKAFGHYDPKFQKSFEQESPVFRISRSRH
jgi:hypothetical protein